MGLEGALRHRADPRRRSELVGLDWDDIDLDPPVIRVRNAKGGRQRTVPIHPALIPPVLDLACTSSSLPPVFC